MSGHNRVFGAQMRPFDHGVKRGVWGRKGVFRGVMGSVPEGHLVPFQECE